ncbi:MAG TPA: hypothetical protein EYP49_04475 [Anaerolineae bacterium]|nr:hypothetical protein [Anaerolineae bacterium]
MAEGTDLLRRIAERAGVEEAAAEEALADLVGEFITTVGKEPAKPAMGIPPYFDRYVATELQHLKEDIAGLRREMNQRFETFKVEMNQRFEAFEVEMNLRFSEVGRRFDEMGAEVNRRFGEVDRHFDEMDAEMNRRFGEVGRRFDRLERWFLALGVPVILGILAIIIKVFFGVP